MKRWAVAFVLCALGAPFAGAGPSASVEHDGVSLHASVSPAEATVVDAVTLRIEAAAPAGVTLEWPASLMVAGEVSGFTVGAVREAGVRIDERGMLVDRREFDLEPFLPGETVLGPFEFGVQREGDAASTLTLPGVTVTITALLDDGADETLAGPKGVLEPPPEERSEWTPWIIAGTTAAGLAIALGVGVAVVRRRRPAPVSARQRALATLALLEDRVRGEGHLGRRPTNDEAYSALSDTLRGYIEGRFGYHATARTTEEFLRDARERRAGLPSNAVERLRAALEACDEVKFAGAEPGLHAAGSAIDEARAFVDAFSDRDAEEGL